MPYAALLSRETRAALGVRLDGAVVVVDEAHNIVEAINSVHSKKVTLSEVRTCVEGSEFSVHGSMLLRWWWCGVMVMVMVRMLKGRVKMG